MPYKPTGKPPGRPRKLGAVEQPETQPEAAAPASEPAGAKQLTRARKGFQRQGVDVTQGLYRPPRFGARNREVGRRPILHPHVIAKVSP